MRWGAARLAARGSGRLIVPCGFIVGARRGIKSRKKPVLRKLEAFLHDKCGVRVVHQIIVGDAVVFDGVVDQPAEKCNVAAGANLEEEVGGGRRARKSRVYGDQLGVAVALGFHRPLESAGMVLGGIAAHDQHHVGVLDVDPAIGHCPASECWSQT